MNIESMSIEEKVGQLFIVSFHDNEINGDLINLITTYNVGGVYYESNNFKNPRQVHKLSTNLQRFADINLPLFIAASQQGAHHNTISNRISVSPSQQKIGQINNRLYTKQMAEIVANELRAMGINLNFAPNLHLSADDESSFGSDIQSTSRHGLAAIQGHHKANVIAAPQLDNYLELFHEDLFTSTTLKPYIKNLQDELETFVFSHDTFTRFSENISTSYINEAKLKESVLVNSLIISDSTEITDPFKVQAAIVGGADLIHLNGTIESQLKIIDGIIKMTKEGTISEEQLNLVVTRILASKQKRNVREVGTFNRENFAQKRSTAFAERLTNF